MPLEEPARNRVLDYCDAHLPARDFTRASFRFIEDESLRERLTDEFYAARYVYKLGEALAATETKLHAHTKFQIVQYAAMYEAVIVHLLWTRFESHPALIAIQYHNILKKHAARLSSSLSLTDAQTGEEIVLCVVGRQKTSPVSIKFDDKVDTAVTIGFLDRALGEEIKMFYKLRNAIHLENAVKNELVFDLASSQLAYRRMQPFLDGIQGFLDSGTLPDHAKVREVTLPDSVHSTTPP